MDYYKLIDDLRWWADQCDHTIYGCQAKRILSGAAFAIETLRAKNAEMEKQLNDAYGTMYNMYGAGDKYCDEKILAFWRRWNGKKEDA